MVREEVPESMHVIIGSAAKTVLRKWIACGRSSVRGLVLRYRELEYPSDRMNNSDKIVKRHLITDLLLNPRNRSTLNPFASRK